METSSEIPTTKRTLPFGAKVMLVIGCLGLAAWFGLGYFLKGGSGFCPVTHSGSDEENLALMRKNLESTARISPNRELQGSVFFKESISLEQFFELLNQYHIAKEKKGAIGPSVTVRYDIRTDRAVPEGAGAGVEMTSAWNDAESFRNWFISDQSKYKEDVIRSSIMVDGFNVHASARTFQKIWEEHPEIVRGVGVTCTSIFYNIKPDDPVVFDGPSPF